MDKLGRYLGHGGSPPHTAYERVVESGIYHGLDLPCMDIEGVGIGHARIGR